MAIYRPPKPRWPAAVAAGVAGLVVGALIGLVLAAREPDPVEAARTINATLARAAASLEVAAIEYEESVEDGDVVNEREYEGARDAVASSESQYRTVAESLRLIAPDRATAIDAAFGALEGLIEQRADPAEFEDASVALAALLEGN